MSENTETNEREPRSPPEAGDGSVAAPRLEPMAARERQGRWLAENAAALESSNVFVAAHGLPLTRYWRF